jgi:hypothetical protein
MPFCIAIWQPLISWFNAVCDGDGGLFDRCFRKALFEDAYLRSSATVAGVFGVKMLNRLLGRLPRGVGVLSCILSFESTWSGLNSTKLATAKLVLIVLYLNASARAYGYAARKSSLSI